MEKISNFKILLIIALGVIFLTIYYFSPAIFTLPEPESEGIKKFASQEEFNAYLAQATALGESYYFGAVARAPSLDVSAPEAAFDEAMGAAPERYSETNVQVSGVDEPDIVKTDGRSIYISSDQDFYYWRREPAAAANKTSIAQAFPVEELSLTGEIDRAGNLLLKDDLLVIFEKESILGYDVSNAKNPQQKWEIEIDSRTMLTGARLYQNTIYLIIANHTHPDRPCLMEPLIINGNSWKVECTDIYHPVEVIPVNTIYSIVAVDLKSGEAKNEISLVGHAGNSIIYMSLSNIYLSYSQPMQMVDFMAGFFKEECSDIFPQSLIQRLNQVVQYDISEQAKMIELEIIFEEYFNSLTEDEELRIENELTNRLPAYYETKKRELESSGIVKIRVDDLKIIATGQVPGMLLNQFAMDEYDNNLRVAVTIGETLQRGFGMPGTQSANDVYVLDESLKQIGFVKDLGLEERIYSVRFIEDKGYLVTFREIDPFYVLDLSDPFDPRMEGELKIPGYSSYLHPISKDKILGIGKEGRNVKISLFDVKDPSDPQEIDKYFLKESWSEVLTNHHAFLLDEKYEMFFLPGSEGAYIFSFENNKISLIRTVKERQVKRALYIDDYLYVVSAERIVVLDQRDWEIIKELSLR
jgi:uncharacterized secreted protein with C-terminal beta-propeller domain